MEVKGNYYIRVRPTGWFVWFQFYSAGKRQQERVDDKAVAQLGFRATMSVDEAKRHCKQLNAERSLLKEKIRVSAQRVTSLTTIDETLFPQDRIDAFKLKLDEENFGSEAHLAKLYSHFNFIMEMCRELRLLPQEYGEAAKRIFKYFIKKKISANYSNRIVSLLNRYGRFASKQTGSYYEDVPMPRGRELSAIADAQKTKSGKNSELGVREASLPLSLSHLEAKRRHLSLEQYNWLRVSCEFGLRPREVDGLLNPKEYRIEYNIKTKMTVLHIYQSKLMGVSEDMRWKIIPVIYKGQLEALDIIKSQKLKRPLTKTMTKYLGQGITLYGGRKAFLDMMLERGQDLTNISMWLGHKTIKRSMQDYKDRASLAFTVTSETLVKAKAR